MVRAPIQEAAAPSETSPSKSSSQGSDGRPDSGFASEVSDSERSAGVGHVDAAAPMEVGEEEQGPSCSGEPSGLSGHYKVRFVGIFRNNAYIVQNYLSALEIC